MGIKMNFNVNIYDNDEVYRRGDYLNLRHYIGISTGRHPVDYEIELSRLNTPTKALQFLAHLLEKTWVTRDMLFRMVCILEKNFKYNLSELTTQHKEGDTMAGTVTNMNTKTSRCTFNEKVNTIDIRPLPDSGYVYQVDLDWCTTSKGVLDWIHQVHEKNWGADVMDEFLELLFAHIPSKLWHGGT